MRDAPAALFGARPGSPPGGEKIAASRAERNGVRQIVRKPDWDRYGRAAPFRRNDSLLNLLPRGVPPSPVPASSRTSSTRSAGPASSVAASPPGHNPGHPRQVPSQGSALLPRLVAEGYAGGGNNQGGSETRIWNKRTDRNIPKTAVHVGRPPPPPHGNPSVIGRGGDRRIVIAKHRRWLWKQMQDGRVDRDRRAAFSGKDLVRHRAPRPCHAQALARAAKREPGRLDARRAATETAR